MLVFLVCTIGIAGTLALSAAAVMFLVVALIERDAGPLHVVAGMAGGFASGALFIWALVPSNWPLSLRTTVAAAFDAETYGHPVEHAAEGIVVWMLFAAVIGALAGPFAGHAAKKLLWRRATHA